MKNLMKIFCIMLCCVLTLSIAACGNNETGGSKTQPPVNSETKNNLEETPGASTAPGTDTSTEENSKTLVVYFSMPDNVDNSSVVIDGETVGNTQYMAYVIQENTGADIFRILPEEPYTTDHDELVDLAKEEQQNNARPKIKDTIENFDSYDMVFVGYPNWWADMPMILYTFFDAYDFSGKTIITFNTHGGSGFSDTNQTIAELEPDAAVTKGLSISRNDIEDAQADIAEWLKGLGYAK